MYKVRWTYVTDSYISFLQNFEFKSELDPNSVWTSRSVSEISLIFIESIADIFKIRIRNIYWGIRYLCTTREKYCVNPPCLFLDKKSHWQLGYASYRVFHSSKRIGSWIWFYIQKELLEDTLPYCCMEYICYKTLNQNIAVHLSDKDSVFLWSSDLDPKLWMTAAITWLHV